VSAVRGGRRRGRRLLRIGRGVQPPPTRARGGAGRSQGAASPPDRSGRDRGGKPGLRGTVGPAPPRAGASFTDPSPSRAARPVDSSGAVSTRFLLSVAAAALLFAGCGGSSHSSSTSGPQSPPSTSRPTTAAGPAAKHHHAARPAPPAAPAGPPPAPDGLRATTGYATYELCAGGCSGGVPASLRRPLRTPASCTPSAPSGPVIVQGSDPLRATPFIGSGWQGGRVTWQASGAYSGPILIRGRQLAGAGAVGFAVVTSALALCRSRGLHVERFDLEREHDGECTDKQRSQPGGHGVHPVGPGLLAGRKPDACHEPVGDRGAQRADRTSHGRPQIG